MDALRRAGTAPASCSVDDTGHAETDRARGSSVVTAAMDTEARVSRPRKDGPVTCRALTRDKAGEVGRRWAWDLTPAADDAVLTESTALMCMTRTSPTARPSAPRGRCRCLDRGHRGRQRLPRAREGRSSPTSPG